MSRRRSKGYGPPKRTTSRTYLRLWCPRCELALMVARVSRRRSRDYWSQVHKSCEGRPTTRQIKARNPIDLPAVEHGSIPQMEPGSPTTEFELHAELYVWLVELAEDYGWTVRGNLAGDAGIPDLSVFDQRDELVVLVEVKPEGGQVSWRQQAKYQAYGVPVIHAIGTEGAQGAYRRIRRMMGRATS